MAVTSLSNARMINDIFKGYSQNQDKPWKSSEENLMDREQEIARQTIDLRRREEALQKAQEELKARWKAYEEETGDTKEIASLLG
jgi:hypothetical protein